MDYDIKVYEKKEKISLVTRIVVDRKNYREEIEKAYRKLLGYMGRKDAYPRGYGFIIYNSIGAEVVDMTIGFPINKEIVVSGDIGMGRGIAGKVLSCTHVGTYDQVAEAYSRLDKYMDEKGIENTGNKFEIHKNEIQDTIESDLITEIGYILKD